MLIASILIAVAFLSLTIVIARNILKAFNHLNLKTSASNIQINQAFNKLKNKRSGRKLAQLKTARKVAILYWQFKNTTYSSHGVSYGANYNKSYY